MSDYKDKWTLVQHSGFGYGGKPNFSHAVEVVTVSSKTEENRVVKEGGILYDDYLEAMKAEDYINGVTGDRPFLSAPGTFSRRVISGLRIYIPKREVGKVVAEVDR